MWSCPHCGESYFTAETMHELERIKTLRKALAVNRRVAVAQFQQRSAQRANCAMISLRVFRNAFFPRMQREPVTSSAIRSIGYEPESATLEIEFYNRRVYRYFDVPEHMHAELMAASSRGAYYSANIRDQFDYRRVR